MSHSRDSKSLWTNETAASQRALRERGWTPSLFNAWWRKTPADRAEISRRAETAGYNSGAQFFRARAQVRAHATTGRPISEYAPPRSLEPREAARRLIKGSRGRRNSNRTLVGQLFPQTVEFDNLSWSQFMSLCHPETWA
jgi:hypothetical protein